MTETIDYFNAAKACMILIESQLEFIDHKDMTTAEKNIMKLIEVYKKMTDQDNA